ncbi:9066_t:CDS:2 [Funneliformis mosseae]|uniref:Glutathione peroxidase n=1 Tax=Funneliformis mosseae TaxID=27381 RepID=A0A9N9A8V4_FUNMO|nr:9066_t:CDS:2 [Funneliformis mosseae]
MADDKSKKPVDFSDFKDKVVLIVNTASKCGFAPQFNGLENLHQKYKDQGLILLGFPSNQFGNQEPGTDEEVQQVCQVNFGVTFPLMSKVEVNGDNAHEVYKYLKNQKAGIAGIKQIKWNFEKFIINKQGKVVLRYSSITKPEDLEKEIVKLLNE